MPKARKGCGIMLVVTTNSLRPGAGWHDVPVVRSTSRTPGRDIEVRMEDIKKNNSKARGDLRTLTTLVECNDRKAAMGAGSGWSSGLGSGWMPDAPLSMREMLGSRGAKMARSKRTREAGGNRPYYLVTERPREFRD